jgi:Domain of unknown function (DUF4055)
MDQFPVAVRSAASAKAKKDNELAATMREGEEGMVAAGAKYLPPLQGEDISNPAEYPARLQRSTFYPFLEEAIGFAVGQVFAKEVKPGKDADERLASWSEDIDLRGNDLHNFAAKIFEDYWWTGAGLFLVDMPPAVQAGDGKLRALSSGEAAAAGRRPFWVRYAVDDVLGWRYQMAGGKRRLVQVRLREAVTIDDPSSEFGEMLRETVRVFWASPLDDRGIPVATLSFSEWTKTTVNNHESWAETTPRTFLKGMTEIPLVILGALGGRCPLYSLARLNYHHWNKQSDLDNIEHVANVPVPYIAGGDTKRDAEGNDVPIKWSPSNLLNLPVGATTGFIEVQGAGITHLKTSLEKLEQEMGRRAMRSLLENKTGQVTATSDAISAGRTYGALQAAALRCQDALEQGQRYTAQWAGLAPEKGGTIEVNQKFFALPRDSQALTFLQWMVDKGLLSKESAFGEAQRYEIIGEGLEYEKEQLLVSEEAAPPAAPTDAQKTSAIDRVRAVVAAQDAKQPAEPAGPGVAA